MNWLEIKWLISKNFIKNLEAKLKHSLTKSAYTEYQIKIIPKRLKVIFHKQRYESGSKFCAKIMCFKSAYVWDRGYCEKHQSQRPTLKTHNTSRIIWTARQNTERDYYAKAIIQPFLTDGTVNPKYMKLYGDPRRDPNMKNHPRNIYHRKWKENSEVNKMLEKFEARKRT